MALIPTSPPAIEPVSLAEAKLHLRIDHADEDALVQSLIQAARAHLELVLSRAFITQGWRYLRDAWPEARELRLPLSPVQSVASVIVHAADGSTATLDPASLVLDGADSQSRLVLAASAARPMPGRAANGLEINFTAGHGAAAADVPAALRHAILLLVAHWYESRMPVEVGSPAEPLPMMVADLIGPYRRKRL
jgi:uncharacterized phiE125 gp8 family phage protein